MTFENKSQKAFIAVTLVTVLAIVSVITVYAVLLGTFQGPGEVTVGGTGYGSVKYTTNGQYAVDNATWATDINGTGVPWYSQLVIDAGGYSGPAKLTWQLEKKIGTDTWANATGTTQTTLVLSGSNQTVYATNDGYSGSSNYNWASGATTAGTYRVRVYEESG